MNAYKLSEIVKIFDKPEVKGSLDIELSAISSLGEAKPTDLTFLGNKKYAHEVPLTRAGAILLPRDYAEALPENSTIIYVDNPSLELAKLCGFIEQFLWKKPQAGVHPSAVIDPTAKVAKSAVIGPNAVICENAVVG
ncbi:MAG: UDP-3-O-(3-hydroxymyristoyl)glucosamine N-acyltransferase, partial [Opitutales bacterium]|nr:UDP-3-O-(3-hydroxymyristoyl)glucosamine N-acyltransferase [Opitutales bacterium]